MLDKDDSLIADYVNKIASNKAEDLTINELLEIQGWKSEQDSPSRDESPNARMRRLSKNVLWRKMRESGTTRKDILDFNEKSNQAKSQATTSQQPPRLQKPPMVQRTVGLKDFKTLHQAYSPYNFRPRGPTQARLALGPQVNPFLAPARGSLPRQRGHTVIYYDPRHPPNLRNLGPPQSQNEVLKQRQQESLNKPTAPVEPPKLDEENFPKLTRANAGVHLMDLSPLKEDYKPVLDTTSEPNLQYGGLINAQIGSWENVKNNVKNITEKIKSPPPNLGAIPKTSQLLSPSQMGAAAPPLPPPVQRESTRLFGTPSKNVQGATGPNYTSLGISPIRRTIPKEESKIDHLAYLDRLAAEEEKQREAAKRRRLDTTTHYSSQQAYMQNLANDRAPQPSPRKIPTRQQEFKIPQMDGNDDGDEEENKSFMQKEIEKMQKDIYLDDLPDWLKAPPSVPKKPEPQFDTAPIDKLFRGEGPHPDEPGYYYVNDWLEKPEYHKGPVPPWSGPRPSPYIPVNQPDKSTGAIPKVKQPGTAENTERRWEFYDPNKAANNQNKEREPEDKMGPYDPKLEKPPPKVGEPYDPESKRTKEEWAKYYDRLKNQWTKYDALHDEWEQESDEFPDHIVIKPRKSDTPDHMIPRVHPIHGQIYRDGDYLVRQPDPPLPRDQLLNPHTYVRFPQPEEHYDEYGYPMKKEFEYEPGQKWNFHGQTRTHLGPNWKRAAEQKMREKRAREAIERNTFQPYPEDFPEVKIPPNYDGLLMFTPSSWNKRSGIYTFRASNGSIQSFLGPDIETVYDEPQSNKEVQFWCKTLAKRVNLEPPEVTYKKLHIKARYLEVEQKKRDLAHHVHWSVREPEEEYMTYGFPPESIPHPGRKDNPFFGNMAGGRFKDPRQEILKERLDKMVLDTEREKDTAPSTSNATSSAPTEKMKLLSTQEEQLKMIKEKCKTDITVADTNQMLLGLIQHLADGKPDDAIYKQMCSAVRDKIGEQFKAAYEKDQQILESKTVASLYDTRLEIPETSSRGTYDSNTSKLLEAYNVLKAIKPYNPEATNNMTDFSDTWRHIISYTRAVKISEEQYIGILLLVLQGQAHKIVHDMSKNNNSLRDILDTLSNLYCKKKTVVDDMKELNEFKRRPNESITTAMSRARLLVEKVKYLFVPMTWRDQCDRMLCSILKQIISKKTRRMVELQEAKKLRIGFILDYKSMLGMVDAFENAYGEVPTTEIATTVNACSGVPVNMDSNFTSETEDLQNKVSQLESMINSISINALDPSDRRSAKERSKSRDRKRSYSDDKKISKTYENQLKLYKKLEDEEKNKMDTSRPRSEVYKPQDRNNNHSYSDRNRSSSNYRNRSNSYSDRNRGSQSDRRNSSSGYDRKRDRREEEKREKRNSQSVERYLRDESSSRRHNSSSRNNYERSRPRVRYDRNSYNRSRSNSGYRSSSNKYSSRPRSSSYKSNYSSRNSSYNRSSTPNYHEKSQSYKRDSRHRSSDRSYDDKKKHLNRDYSRENFKQKQEKYGITDVFKDKNGKINGFTVNHVHYYKCPSQQCNTMHPQNHVCDKVAKN